MPEADESAQAVKAVARFGALTGAFALVKRITRADDWDATARRSTVDSWR